MIATSKKMGVALLVVLITLVSVTASAALNVTHLTEGEFLAMSPTIEFVAEGRIGSNSIGGFTFEYDLKQDTSITGGAEGHFVWPNAYAVPFNLQFNGETALFNVGQAPVLYYTPELSGPLTDIFVRTRATDASYLMVAGMNLNGLIIDEYAAAPPTDYLWIRGIDLSEFNFTGFSLMAWEGDTPKNSALAYQIKVGSVPTNPIPEWDAPLLSAMGVAGYGLTYIRRRRRA